MKMKLSFICSHAWPTVPRRLARTALALAAGLGLTLSAPVEAAEGGGAGPSDEPAPATAPAADDDSPVLVLEERVSVVGRPSTVETIPGSAHFLGGQELEQAQVGFDDINHILQRVPGVHVQEEEGFGRRPNIGLRGAGSDRSAKITLLEDGVLIAPAPYAAPAAYYFPVTGRMEGLEVRKGSSQIKYGPNTTGGALNLVSTGIPDPFTLRAQGELGTSDLRKLHAHVGDTWGRLGWMLETYQSSTDGFKRLDGGGGTGFDLEDYLGKLRYATGPGSSVYQQIELKLGYTSEDADETYLGLTEEDFRQDPLRRYSASQRDDLRARHEQYQLRHFLATKGGIDLTTTLYRNEFERNWYKLQSVLGESPAEVLDAPGLFTRELDVLRGGDSGDDALRVRANARTYLAEGIETILGLRGSLGPARHEVELGVRYHLDQEDRFQHEDAYRMSSGRMLLTSPGDPGSQSNRVSAAEAWAFFLQDRIEWGRLTLTPGARAERIELERLDYARTDPDRLGPAKDAHNRLTVFVPGVGAAWTLEPGALVFVGVHRGFAPPGPGSTEETRSEEAWNYEVGARLSRAGLQGELVGFYDDYDNLLGRDTLSTGGTGSGDLFNGGSVQMYGLEASTQIDLGRSLGLGANLPLRASYTFSRATFRSAFESSYEAWGSVEEGDELPYLPEHQLYVGLGLRAGPWTAELGLRYLSRMRAEAGQGPLPEGRGTDAQFLLDASLEYGLTKSLRVFAAAQNLANAAFVVARRPAGARPNLPRTVSAGVRLDLGS